MRTSLFGGIRWKIVLLFFMSFVFAAFTLVALFLAILFVDRTFPNSLPMGIIRLLGNKTNVPVVMSVSGFVLFILYVFLISNRSVRYLVEITRSLEHVANGDFDRTISVRTNDELGDLAENINIMASRLKASLDEERRAVQAKNELVTSVSHDLRTPLTSITGYLGLIDQDRYRDEVELRHYVQIAHEKALRMHGLINDLFEYTRASGGGMRLCPAPLNLQELLGQLAAQYDYQLQKEGMAARLHFPEAKLIVLADGDKLVRVFENLLVNAIVYGKQGGAIDIVARRANGWAAVDMVNYGEPIPRADLPHIFDRFYRVEKSRSAYLGGSGLGLAIAKQIVELHGGTISAASDSDRTVFSVNLPLAERPKR